MAGILARWPVRPLHGRGAGRRVCGMRGDLRHRSPNATAEGPPTGWTRRTVSPDWTPAGTRAEVGCGSWASMSDVSRLVEFRPRSRDSARRIGSVLTRNIFHVSATGTLAYAAPASPVRRTMAWVDRAGREEAIPAPPAAYINPRMSPDGTRVALDIGGAGRDIWVWNFARATLTQISKGPTRHPMPAWNLTGTRVYYGSDRVGTHVPGIFGRRRRRRDRAGGTGGAGQLYAIVDAETGPVYYVCVRTGRRGGRRCRDSHARSRSAGGDAARRRRCAIRCGCFSGWPPDRLSIHPTTLRSTSVRTPTSIGGASRFPSAAACIRSGGRPVRTSSSTGRRRARSRSFRWRLSPTSASAHLVTYLSGMGSCARSPVGRGRMRCRRWMDVFCFSSPCPEAAVRLPSR